MKAYTQSIQLLHTTQRYQRSNNNPSASVHLTYLLTYLLHGAQSFLRSWFAASQEIPRISRNPKTHYRTHKRPPPVSILVQPNPVHIPTSHLLEIHPNIHLSTPRSPQWSPSLRFPYQDPIHPPLLTHTRHIVAPCISYDHLISAPTNAHTLILYMCIGWCAN